GPEPRPAQRALAEDITARTHGAAAGARAIADSEAMFSDGAIHDPESLRSLFESTGGFAYDPALLDAGSAVLLADAGVFGSKGEARRMIAAGGVTINGQRVSDADFVPK